jgi:ATP-dependent DNA helicase 2 subunit 1
MADDTAHTVEKEDIRKAYKFGGEQVSFTTEEQQALRHFGDPVIRIIGFKPLSALPIWANVKHPSFIYPSEEDYVGSTRVFSALQQKLLEAEKMALVWFIPRRNASPVLAAMIAGAEKIDENGVQKIPPGMWIIPIPFADDIRENPEATLNKAPDTLIDAMREVIQQLQLPKAVYDPSKYPNPCMFGQSLFPPLKNIIDSKQHFNGIIVFYRPLRWKRTCPSLPRTRLSPNIDRSIR